MTTQTSRLEARVDLAATETDRQSGRLMRRIGWLVMTLTSIAIAVYGLSYLFREIAPTTKTPQTSDEHFNFLLDRHWLRFAAHFVFGPIALMVGPFQFLGVLRRSMPGLHRSLGYIYALSISVAGTAGLILAFGSWGGLTTHIGFGMLAVLWLISTWLAVWHARHGRYAIHRRFMVRSFALTFAAPMLRLWIPLFMAQGIEFDQVYQTVAWLSWVPNLIFAEWLLQPRPARAVA